MELYATADNHNRKASVADVLETQEHVANYDFHILFTERPWMSAVLQGFARFMYFQKTGEANLDYNTMHKTLTAHELKGFLTAFGYEFTTLPNDVSQLWTMVTRLFTRQDTGELTAKVATLEAQLEGYKNKKTIKRKVSKKK